LFAAIRFLSIDSARVRSAAKAQGHSATDEVKGAKKRVISAAGRAAIAKAANKSVGDGQEGSKESRQLNSQIRSNCHYQSDHDFEPVIRKLFDADRLSKVFRFHRVVHKRKWIGS
jgi:hypothetical protein